MSSPAPDATPRSGASGTPGASACPGTLLVISQVYVPDPASVGQYMADAAAGMARRGWRVVVLTANRGYDDPTRRYPAREVRDGVEVRRLPCSSFGKRSIPIRLLGAVAFLVQAVLRGLFLRDLRCILVSTSPPIAPLAALALHWLRCAPVKYWAMDINPDQMVALGRARAGSLPVRLFDAMNRLILGAASDVVTLDDFMAQRLRAKRDLAGRLTILPPWPHAEYLDAVPAERNPFRAQHGLEGKFLITYSGNMSIASPLDTIVQAALRLRDEPDLVFLFIGGGLGKEAIDHVIASERPGNLRTLPYLPLEEIRYSLSAADVHLVSMGAAIVGICHPSKVYPALAVGRPILFLGPPGCHAAQLLEQHGIGWRIGHGEVDAAVALLRALRRTEARELAAMGARARHLMIDQYDQQALGRQFCDVLERGVRKPRAAAPAGVG